MNCKIILAHLSDLHLGRKSRGDLLAAGRLNSLRHAIKRVSECSPDAILIAGDTFDSPQIEQAIIKETVRIFESVRRVNGEPIDLVVIPGNHDPSDSESLWRNFRNCLSSNSPVRIILAPEVVELCERRLLVEAYPCQTRYSAEAPWNNRLSVPQDDDVFRVVLAHGTLIGGPVPEGESDAFPFSVAEVEGLDADYVALGHFHGLYPPWRGDAELRRSVCYCGTHEADQFGGDSGNAVIATLEKGQSPVLRRLKVGRRHWRLLEIGGPGDIQKGEQLRQEVGSSDEPDRFVIRFKLSPKTRLAPDDVEQIEQIEASLRALGATVDRQGDIQVYVDVQALDLDALPSGAVKETLLALQCELAQAGDESRREVITTAIMLGWEELREAP